MEYNGRFWGTTTYGGSKGMGVVFSANIDGTDYVVVHDFRGTDGENPSGGLIESEGRLWGTTTEGGISDRGVLYNIEPDDKNFSIVLDLSLTIGSNPVGGLTKTDTHFWGVMKGGSANGAIFRINLDGTDFTNVHALSEEEGIAPQGNLLLHDNRLWGVCWWGGTKGGYLGGGTIFSINSDGTGFNTIHDFDGIDGDWVNGDLKIIDNKIWGTSFFGGENNVGVVYNIIEVSR